MRTPKVRAAPTANRAGRAIFRWAIWPVPAARQPAAPPACSTGKLNRQAQPAIQPPWQGAAVLAKFGIAFRRGGTPCPERPRPRFHPQGRRSNAPRQRRPNPWARWCKNRRQARIGRRKPSLIKLGVRIPASKPGLQIQTCKFRPANPVFYTPRKYGFPPRLIPGACCYRPANQQLSFGHAILPVQMGCQDGSVLAIEGGHCGAYQPAKTRSHPQIIPPISGPTPYICTSSADRYLLAFGVNIGSN